MAPKSITTRTVHIHKLIFLLALCAQTGNAAEQPIQFHLEPTVRSRSTKSEPQVVDQKELLDEKSLQGISVPVEFPTNHGISSSPNPPPTLDRRMQVRLPDRRWLYLDPVSGEHWICIPTVDGTATYWGPMTTDQLVKFGLLEKIATIWIKQANTDRNKNGNRDAQRAAPALLAARDTPLSALGLSIATTTLMEKGYREDIVDSLRKQRVKLISQGLEKEMRAALNRLTANEPPLPKPTEFTDIKTSAELPAGFADSMWGPVDEGLCAAAVMPAEIPLNDYVAVRFFFKNVGDQPLYLAVCKLGTFNHPEVKDAKGKPVNLKLPVIYSGMASGAAIPLRYPDGHWAPLIRLMLAPGVVYELEPSYLHWELQPPPQDQNHRPSVDAKISMSTTNIYGPAGEITIKWNLKTTSGRQLDRKHPWPTKGCWSGVPQTPPQRVMLKL